MRHATRAGRLASTSSTRAPRKPSRRQVLESLYGLHNADEWSEEYLELLVGDLLTALGLWSYHTDRSERSDKGWPDEAIIGGREVLYAELKTATGTVSADQADVIHRLNSSGALVRVYRPDDWRRGTVADEIRSIVRGPGRPAEAWPADCYRCGCRIVVVHTDGHVTGCPIERTVRKTPAGNPGRPWWKR